MLQNGRTASHGCWAVTPKAAKKQKISDNPYPAAPGLLNVNPRQSGQSSLIKSNIIYLIISAVLKIPKEGE